MDLYLARHGNTFNKGDRIVWVGRNEDLPLTVEGFEQARRLGGALRSTGAGIAKICCGPLRRTKDFAETLAAELAPAVPLHVDPRLTEIDYGLWGSLSDDEIIARFGRDELEAWSKESNWPASGVWGSREDEVREAVRSFASAAAAGSDNILAVTSNGVLRYFLSLIEGELERRVKNGTFKVRTGSVCKLTWNGSNFCVSYWDQRPEDLLQEG